MKFGFIKSIVIFLALLLSNPLVLSGYLLLRGETDNVGHSKQGIGDIETYSPISTGYKSQIGTKDALVFVLFTGEENGYIEPCGCTQGQLGGMKRRYAFVETLKKSGLLLPVSLGDIPGEVNRQNEIKMQVILHAFDIMGYVAHNLGEKDIAIGYEALNYLTQIYNVPFISSNVRFNDLPGIKIQPYLVKKIKTRGLDIKVGFLGILSPDLVEDIPYNTQITDPVEAIRPLIKRLRKKTHLLVLLSHSGADEALEIAANFPEIDLIITGHGIDDPNTFIKMMGKTLVVSPGRFGKHIGIVQYLFDKKGRIRQLEGDLPIKFIPLGEEFNKPSLMDSLIEEYKLIVKEEDLLGRYDKVSIDRGGSYIGSMSCGTCHIKIYSHWKTTKHAVAYETLENVGYQFDPECVRCHVVGLPYESGFKSIKDTPDLKAVGCEACHDFGSFHITETKASYGKVNEMDCVNCHDPENSPAFEYNSYWEMIKHPVEGKGSRYEQ